MSTTALCDALAGPLSDTIKEVTAYRRSTRMVIVFGVLVLIAALLIGWTRYVAWGSDSPPMPGALLLTKLLAISIGATWILLIVRHQRRFGSPASISLPLSADLWEAWNAHIRAFPFPADAREVLEAFLLVAPSRPSADLIALKIEDAAKLLQRTEPSAKGA